MYSINIIFVISLIILIIAYIFSNIDTSLENFRSGESLNAGESLHSGKGSSDKDCKYSPWWACSIGKDGKNCPGQHITVPSGKIIASRNQCAGDNPNWREIKSPVGREHFSISPAWGDTRILKTINKDNARYDPQGGYDHISNVLINTKNDPLNSPEYRDCLENVCLAGQSIASNFRDVEKNNRRIIELNNLKDNYNNMKTLYMGIKSKYNDFVTFRSKKERIDFVDSLHNNNSKLYLIMSNKWDELENWYRTNTAWGPEQQDNFNKYKTDFRGCNWKGNKECDRKLLNFIGDQIDYIKLWYEDARDKIQKQIELVSANTKECNNVAIQGELIKKAGFNISTNALDGEDEEDIKAGCNKICQSHINCKGFNVSNKACTLFSNITGATTENGVKAYRPLRGCNKDNWTVKNLVNNYSGGRQNMQHNRVVIPMDGPIGMNNSGNIEFSYTLWFKINRTSDRWRGLFRRGPRHPEDTIRLGRYPWSESREPGVWIWPNVSWGGKYNGTGIHIRFGTKTSSWNAGNDIPSQYVKMNEWTHLTITIRNSQICQVWIHDKEGREVYNNTKDLLSKVNIRADTKMPIIVGVGNEGGWDHVNYNNSNAESVDPGYEIRNFQVYRTSLNDKYITGLVNSNVSEGILNEKPVYEGFSNKKDKCGQCVNDDECKTGMFCFRTNLHSIKIDDNEYIRLKNELRQKKKKYDILSQNIEDKSDDQYVTVGPESCKPIIVDDKETRDHCKISSEAELDALRNTAPDECKKRDDALGYCYKDGRCNIPPVMREQCPYVNKVNGNWTHDGCKSDPECCFDPNPGPHGYQCYKKNPIMFNAVAADKTYANSLLSKIIPSYKAVGTNNPNTNPPNPLLDKCGDECDRDSDCKPGLKCFQRSKGEPIPGCDVSRGPPTHDYCYDPSETNINIEGPAKTLIDSIVNHEHINSDSSTTKCKIENPTQMVYVKTPSTYKDANNYCKSIGRELLSFAGKDGKGGGARSNDTNAGVKNAKKINDFKFAQIKEIMTQQAPVGRKNLENLGIWIAQNDIKHEGHHLNNDGQLGAAGRGRAWYPRETNGHEHIHRKGFYPCQKWDEQTPHRHSNSKTHKKSYWKNKQTAGNDYMNPDGEPEGNWCYATDKNQRWVYERQINSRNKLYHGGEPNDWSGGEDCTHLVKWGTGLTGTGLNDIGCHYKLPFICEKEVDDPTSLGSNICLDK